MRVLFEDKDGIKHEVSADVGESLMSCATRNLISGIVGECGGAMACATCHAYIIGPESQLATQPTEGEMEMLEGCFDNRASSRLTCQVILTEGMDGVKVIVPNSQI